MSSQKETEKTIEKGKKKNTPKINRKPHKKKKWNIV